MNKLFIVCLTALFFLLAPFASADTGSEVLQRVDSDITVLNNLLSEAENQNNPDDISKYLLSRIPTVVMHLEESSSIYDRIISTTSDSGLRATVINIKKDIGSLSADLSRVKNALSNGNAQSYENAFTSYDNHIDSLNNHIEELNSSLGVVDYSWLVFPFLVSIVISVSLFVISRGNPVLPAEQLRNKFEFQLFKTSLWPLVGSGISYIWYVMTPPGGTFYILYGFIGFGYFVFFKGLFFYFSEARSAINLAKSEQEAKLQELISSEEFQQAGFQDQSQDEEMIRDVKCSKCESVNKAEAKFCKKCGKKLSR